MKRETQFVLIISGLLIATPLCLLIFYGRWDDWGFWPGFLMTFDKWSWGKLSALWTGATTLGAHASVSWKGYEASGGAYICSWMIAMALLWVFYPGTVKLGVFSDSKLAYAIISMVVLHTIGFWMLRRLKLRELDR